MFKITFKMLQNISKFSWSNTSNSYYFNTVTSKSDVLYKYLCAIFIGCNKKNLPLSGLIITITFTETESKSGICYPENFAQE